MTTSPVMTIDIGSEPDAAPTLSLFNADATAELVKGGLGRYLLRVTFDGEGVVQGRVSWSAGGVAGSYDFTVTFLRDELTEARLRKLDLIGTGNATGSAPVLENGQFGTPLVLGDDYVDAVARAIEWVVTSSVEPVSCKLGFYLNSANNFILDGTVSAVDGEDDQYLLSFDLSAATSALKRPGLYEYSLEIRDASGKKITKFHSHFYEADGSDAKNYVRFVKRRT